MVSKSDLPRPPLVSGSSIPEPVSERAETTTTVTFTLSPTLLVETSPTITVECATSMPSSSSAPSLPELMKKLGQIKSKLQSPPTSHELPLFQKACHLFKDWMKKDFIATFSLKVLHDVEKALVELHQAQLLSQTQYKSFLGFFENLRALRDQYQKAERVANRVKCYQDKHVKSMAALHHLVGKGSGMKERIAVVDAEIQLLEEQLFSLKAEKVALTDRISKKVEEMEKTSQKVEDSKSQLVNSNTYLGELNRIFTTMQTYFSRVVALAEDVKLLD